MYKIYKKILHSFPGVSRMIREVSHVCLSAHTLASNLQLPFLNQQKEKRKYVARPGIKARTPDLRVRCPTDCSMWPGRNNNMKLAFF